MVAKTYAVSTQHDHPAVQQLARCIECLRSVCDGAVSRDYQGFSAFDANLGHYLADQLANHQGWSRQDLGYAVQLAWRYREQLGRAGLSFPTYAELKAEIEDLPEAETIAVAPTPSTAGVRLYRLGSWLCLAFSHYDHGKLAQLMSATPMEDRWWDEAGTRWLINPRHAAGLSALYGVDVEDAPTDVLPISADTQPAAQPTPAPARARTAGDVDTVTIADYDATHVAVRCPFALKDTLKAAVPWKHREWVGATKTWVVDRVFEATVRAVLGVA
ncbi:hypothetical protein K2Z83_15570 [Oscillochloris sp. ZM17-4]|uniref:hypothetical protein n=1 Tax=Oscillochloris sp. ZM17-4 TaxID=2866714 RepID=UPI001C72D844|nr:hypothetical protein [Oscillochloris sp. ZM17-4]MBX0329096.1 hypothetical protein [Oscillochloris sp. ZM17-4]